jgi:hypothetical protein
MARMKIGSKTKAKQPENSYAVSVQMSATKDEPEVVEKIVEVPVEKVVEVEKIVEVPVRLDQDNGKRIEEVVDAKIEEVNDLIESMSDSMKSQDRRIKELEIEIDRELATEMERISQKADILNSENIVLSHKLRSLEKICAGMIIVMGLTILMIMSI